jgi:tetratricopeptide (TPR) repeat protein
VDDATRELKLREHLASQEKDNVRSRGSTGIRPLCLILVHFLSAPVSSLLFLGAQPTLAQGNALFKEGKYQAAVDAYSRGMEFDPTSHLLASNRAMALLKLKRSAPGGQLLAWPVSLTPIGLLSLQV